MTGGHAHANPAAAIEEVLAGAMRQATLHTERRWKELAEISRRTGRYLRSITSTVHVVRTGGRVEITGTVGTSLEYAPYLEYGTGLYGPKHQVIRPKQAQALRWPAGGRHTFDMQTYGYTGFKPGAGFRLSGQQRSGAAGAQARYRYAKYVRGIRPLHYARRAAHDSQEPARQIFHAAGTELARVLSEGE